MQVDYKRLPFDHCALSLQPFENPYCDDEGNVFDLVHIVPFIKRYKMNPCTGKPLNAKDLVKLKFFKTPTGEYHCPVMYKQFNNSTHIAVVKTTGLNITSFSQQIFMPPFQVMCSHMKHWKS